MSRTPTMLRLRTSPCSDNLRYIYIYSIRGRFRSWGLCLHESKFGCRRRLGILEAYRALKAGRSCWIIPLQTLQEVLPRAHVQLETFAKPYASASKFQPRQATIQNAKIFNMFVRVSGCNKHFMLQSANSAASAIA